MLAKKFGAAVVSLEHRYYGESSPFEELTTDNLKYLSSKQALFDLASYRNFYQVLIFRVFDSIGGVRCHVPAHVWMHSCSSLNSYVVSKEVLS